MLPITLPRRFEQKRKAPQATRSKVGVIRRAPIQEPLLRYPSSGRRIEQILFQRNGLRPLFGELKFHRK